MKDLGWWAPGSTLVHMFPTYDSNDPTASVTMSGLAVTGIEVYKGTSMTQRASDSGYALIDTTGIDIDSTTGANGFSIDLSDNTTAGFYSAGSVYHVWVNGMTVDAGSVSYCAGFFRIGNPAAILNTTLATLASQTSFTLTAGSADDDAYNGCIAVIHDVASDVQMAIGTVLDYTGSTKTVTLKADPGIFTMAATDNIMLLPPPLPTTALTEGYAADGSEATIEQLLYMIWSAVHEFSISGTTMTGKKLDSTTSMTWTLDDATNPTSRTRAT